MCCRDAWAPPARWQHHGCVTAASVGQPREESYRVCRYGCCVSQERINVSAIPKAPGVFLQPLSSRFAYPGFSKQCRQREQQGFGVTNRISSTTVLKPLTVWITANWKILKDMGLSDHLTCLLRNLYAGQEAKFITVHGKMDFKIVKGVCKGCIFYPVYLTYMQNNHVKSQAG